VEDSKTTDVSVAFEGVFTERFGWDHLIVKDSSSNGHLAWTLLSNLVVSMWRSDQATPAVTNMSMLSPGIATNLMMLLLEMSRFLDRRADVHDDTPSTSDMPPPVSPPVSPPPLIAARCAPLLPREVVIAQRSRHICDRLAEELAHRSREAVASMEMDVWISSSPSSLSSSSSPSSLHVCLDLPFRDLTKAALELDVFDCVRDVRKVALEVWDCLMDRMKGLRRLYVLANNSETGLFAGVIWRDALFMLDLVASSSSVTIQGSDFATLALSVETLAGELLPIARALRRLREAVHRIDLSAPSWIGRVDRAFTSI
jgi:hypothetical protein